MTKTNESAENSSVEPVEQPVGADNGDNVQTSWLTGEISKDARMWAMFCHLAGLAGLSPILPVIGSAVAPLVIWQMKKDEFPFVDEQGKQAVNFQLSMLLYGAIGTVVCLVTCIEVLMLVVLWVVGLVDLIFVLIGAVRANHGQHYHYPLAIRFFK
jgi:uncharacterized Tic20 family protein